MSLLALIVCLPLFLGTGLCAWAGPRRRLTAWLAAAVTAGALGVLIAQAPAVLAGQTLLSQAAWMPAIGLNASFRLDGLAWLFAVLITAIGLLIILYAAYYLRAQDSFGKFYSQLMLFMAAMLGVALADNLLLLVMFWELTSLSSFLLVGFWGHRADARAGARMALTVTGAGGLALLAGVLVLGQIGGSYELSTLLGQGALIRADDRYPLVLALVLLGCFTKSAQWPFHFWLPEAMAAPTPVSAYLHSATMVKAGLFLMMRLYPVLGGSELFALVVTGTGLLTLVFAAYVAVFRHDLKGLLAYSTISHLGLITTLIGLGSPLAAVAAVFHLLNHATFKAALFMSAGIIDHETGTRDMRQLGGLLRFLPWTGTLAMVAAASMAGVPLFNGFLSKEMFFAESWQGPAAMGWLLPIAATLGGVCSVAYSLRFAHDVFFNGPPRHLPKPQPHEPPFFMRLPVALLALLCVAVGLLPNWTYGPVVHVAAAAMLGAEPPPYQLALWHGWNLPLLMSALALSGGALMYAALQHQNRLHLHLPHGWTARLWFTHSLDALHQAATGFTERLANGSLQRYLAWMIASAIALAAWPFWLAGSAPGTGPRALTPAEPLAVALWLVLLACSAALVREHRERYQAVVLAGVVGLVTALCFIGFSSPDLALTQLAVEVVSTVLLLMGLALLPARSPRESSARRRGRDALLALTAGAGVGWLAWLVMTRPQESLSWYYLAHALKQGGGANVVNVILVDFRGYDTFGEITVLGIAGVGMLALLDGWRTRRPAADAQGQAWGAAPVPLLLRMAARLVLPMTLLVSVYIYWRGHQLPGGGFIAGLLTSAALVLQYMAWGQQRADLQLRAHEGRRYTQWIGCGLGVAWATGVGAFFWGRPFMTSAHGHPVLPWLGEVGLASAALFDLGVYVTVVGATMLMLSTLGAVSKETNR